MSEETLIAPGEQAPDFELPDQDGTRVRLSDLRGKRVVVYFYPKADTPGCTTQACGARDRATEYEMANAVVLGVSPDAPAALRKFADKHGLAFTLLGDEDHLVAEAYGVWVEKTNYGQTYFGNQRSTFVVDERGVVRHVIPKVTPKTHDDEVLTVLEQL